MTASLWRCDAQRWSREGRGEGEGWGRRRSRRTQKRWVGGVWVLRSHIRSPLEFWAEDQHGGAWGCVCWAWWVGTLPVHSDGNVHYLSIGLFVYLQRRRTLSVYIPLPTLCQTNVHAIYFSTYLPFSLYLRRWCTFICLIRRWCILLMYWLYLSTFHWDLFYPRIYKSDGVRNTDGVMCYLTREYKRRDVMAPSNFHVLLTLVHRDVWWNEQRFNLNQIWQRCYFYFLPD